MTARELINALQDLGEENLDREIVMFDSPNYYTPNKIQYKVKYKVKFMTDRKWENKVFGNIMIDLYDRTE